MKRGIFLTILVLLALCLSSQDALKFLKIDPPPEAQKGKNRLAIPVAQLEGIIRAEGITDKAITVELVNPIGKMLSLLASFDKGKIKWNHKVADKTTLLAEFPEEDYAPLLDKVQKKVVKPDILLAFREKQTGMVLKRYIVTLADLPDLAVSMEYPIQTQPGEPLAGKINVKIENQGVAPARDVAVEIVLSGDDRIPVRKAAYSETWAEDGLLQDGRQVIPLIEPGQTVSITMGGGIKVPDNVQPQKYYLGIVVDPENAIAEIDENDNTFRQVMMISVPAPSRFVIDLPDAKLRYEPKERDSVFTIEGLGLLLSDGKDWRICRMKPYLYQMKPRYEHWKDFHWEVETYGRTVYEVRGAEFCKKGGRPKDLKMKVEVRGGSDTVPPKFFVVSLPKAQIVYEPTAKKFNVLVNGLAIDYPGLWTVIAVAPHRYQMRFRFWQDYFIEVDTYKREVLKVSGGTFPSREIQGTVICKDISVEK